MSVNCKDVLQNMIRTLFLSNEAKNIWSRIICEIKNCVFFLIHKEEHYYQGILSITGIAGYEWVPAGKEGYFFQNKIFFHNTYSQLKIGKTETHWYADTSPA